MASSYLIDWPTYLDKVLLAYHISHHGLINIPPFKAFYGCNLVMPSIIMIMASLAGPKSANANMRLIAEKLIHLQVLAADSLFRFTLQESYS